MPERELFSPRFDQPPLSPGRVRRPYVICSTPRSGSWLLCRQLINAGMGVPSEYFNPGHFLRLCLRWNLDPDDTHAYIRALYAHRTSPNGVWGSKVLWSHYTTAHRTALDADLFGRSRLIFLYRDDVVRQAVSLHLSRITGIWGFDGIPERAPHRDIASDDLVHLGACDREVRGQNRMWNELFASRGLDPLVIRYEDFVVDQPGAVARIARELGLAASEVRIPPPEPRENTFAPDVEASREILIERLRSARRDDNGDN